jgi:hypothetical protein
MSDPLNPHYDDDAVTYDSDFFYADEPVSQPTPTKHKTMATLKLNTSRMNPAQLIAKADIVLPKIAPPAPEVPPVPNMTARAAALQTARDSAKTANDAYEQAKAGLPALKEARDAAADALRAQHNAMGSALEGETQDPVALSATGYELAGTNTTPSGPPEVIDNLKITAGDMNSALDGSFDPDAAAYVYEVQMTTVDPVNGPWVTVANPTASVFQLTGLTSGQRVWVRVRGIGTMGPGPWSDPYTKIVP